MDNLLVEIQQFVLNNEKELNLFDLKYHNIFLYKLIRQPLFEKIQFMTDALDIKYGVQRDKLKKLGRIIKYSFKNLFIRYKKADILYLMHGRKTLYNGKWVDIYLDESIKKEIKQNNKIFLIDRPSPDGKHNGYEKIDKKYFEHFALIKRELCSRFFKFDKSFANENAILIALSKKIEDKFNIKIDIIGLAKEHIYRFMLEKKHFKKVLKKIQPKEVKIVVAYGKEELVSAANDLGIKVTEYQHGLINKFHFAYYFPICKNIPYFPDTLECFGQYWFDLVNLPASVEKKVYTNLLMQDAVDNANEVIKIKNKVVFLSSCDSKELHIEAINFAKKNPQYQVHYKFHPSEYLFWQRDYPDLLKASDQRLINIVEPSVSLYSAISNSEYVISTSSTCVYEALMLDCSVFIIKIGGYIWLQDLVDDGYIKFLSKDYKIDEESAKLSKADKNKFYEGNNNC